MITKPDRIIKRIIKAVGQRQSVLVIGDWQEELIKGIRGNENSIAECKMQNVELEDNSFTRIVANYGDVIARNDSDEAISFCQTLRDCFVGTNVPPRNDIFFAEARRLLLPTGILIISAHCEDSLLTKIMNIFRRTHIKEENHKKIKPKVLQDQIHDNEFLIDGYYGYPGGHLLMMAQIQNKNVTTLFTSEKQETIKI